MTWHPSQGLFDPHTNRQFETSGTPAFVVTPNSVQATAKPQYIEDLDDLSIAVASVNRLTGASALIEAFVPGMQIDMSS